MIGFHKRALQIGISLAWTALFFACAASADLQRVIVPGAIAAAAAHSGTTDHEHSELGDHSSPDAHGSAAAHSGSTEDGEAEGGYRCAHDHVTEPLLRKQKAFHKGIPHEAHHAANPWRRQLAESPDPAPVRIAVEYQLGALEDAKADFLQGSLLPAVTSQLARLIKVKHPVEGNLKLPRLCKSYWESPDGGAMMCEEVFDIGFCGEYEGAAAHNPEYFGSYSTCDCSGASTCDCSDLPGGAGLPYSDFILYVTAAEMDFCLGGYLKAIGGFCVQDLVHGRPVAGFVNFCPEEVSSGSNVGMQIDVAVHEVLHGLVFSPALWDDFVDGDGNKVGAGHVYFTDREKDNGVEAGWSTVTKLNSPKVLEAARAHFACDELDGAALETEGGDGTAGSHWESRFFKSELMTGAHDIGSRSIVSNLTLGLLEDSGWYLPTYELEMPLYWGKDAGCSFAEELSRCSDARHFCLGEMNDCTLDYKAVGYCAEDPLMNGCRAYKPYLNLLCADEVLNDDESRNFGNYYGLQSRCLPQAASADWELAGTGDMEGFVFARSAAPGCYNVSCANDESGKLALYVTMYNKTLQCPEGELLYAERFSDLFAAGALGPCPPPDLICATLGCANDCSGYGECVYGKCHCYAGMTGDDCSSPICTFGDVVSCPSGTVCNLESGTCGLATPPSPPSPPPVNPPPHRERHGDDDDDDGEDIPGKGAAVTEIDGIGIWKIMVVGLASALAAVLSAVAAMYIRHYRRSRAAAAGLRSIDPSDFGGSRQTETVRFYGGIQSDQI